MLHASEHNLVSARYSNGLVEVVNHHETLPILHLEILLPRGTIVASAHGAQTVSSHTLHMTFSIETRHHGEVALQAAQAVHSGGTVRVSYHLGDTDARNMTPLMVEPPIKIC